MKRRFLSLILVLVLCTTLALTAYAAPGVSFVVDEWEVLADSELTQLNELAGQIYDTLGVGIFFVFTNAEDLESIDPAQIAGDIEDYYIMIENEEYWWSFFGGKGEMIDLDTESTLRAAYDAPETYVDGIESFLYATAECFPTYIPEDDILPAINMMVFDEADILSDAEELALEEKLVDASYAYDAQLVVATISDLDGGDIDGFIEFIYDEMDFGFGENHDGALLLVCMDPREYRILTNGMADEAIGESGINAIGDVIVSDLSDGNYSDAFNSFADECAYYLDGHINGFPFKFGKNLVIALVIGIIAGVVVALALKAQLKTVRQQKQANVYIKSGSMQLTASNDIFLYRTVERRKKENNSSGSSGSSGSSRSVGGGSF